MDKDAYIIQIEEEIRCLNEQLADLVRRFGLNSTNSSKPPAAEGLAKPSHTQSTLSKSKKSPGGAVWLQRTHPRAGFYALQSNRS